jgi:hypothetical protein
MSYKCIKCDDEAIDYCSYCLKHEMEQAAEKQARLDDFKKLKPLPQMLHGIVVWPFEHAPKMYRSMSDNGGDEDWVAVVPPMEVYPWWLDKLDTCEEPQVYEIADGYKVYIGSHA